MVEIFLRFMAHLGLHFGVLPAEQRRRVYIVNIKKRNEKNYLECFVILPFAGEYEDIYHFAIEPALAECNYQSVRIDEHDVVPRAGRRDSSGELRRPGGEP